MPQQENQNIRSAGFSSEHGTSLPTGKSWFFGIGINAYKHFPHLHNARKDVEDFLQLLQERYQLDDAISLLDEMATRNAIIDQLSELQGKVKEQDKLIIFYSGHGNLDTKGRGYWLPVDSAPRKASSFIRSSTIRELVEDIECQHILLISDSCFSGALLTRNAGHTKAALEELERDRSRWVISSGRQREEVADGRPGENSPFTSSILKVLRKNQEPRLNAGLLFDQVIKLTRFNYKQMPQSAPLFGTGHGGGQYIFRLKANEVADWKACQEAGTLAAYQAFLAKYPNSTYAEKAKEYIFLKDEQAWKIARGKNTIPGYIQYRKDFPTGSYREHAREMIHELEEAQDWREALRLNKVFAYEDYLEKYPDGRYRREAEAGKQAILGKQYSGINLGVPQPPHQPKPKPETKTIPKPPQEDESRPMRKPLKRFLPYLVGLLFLIVAAIWIVSWFGASVEPPVNSADLTPYQDSESNQYGYRNQEGKTIITPRFDFAYSFSEDRAVVKQGSLNGYINPKGELVADFQYQQAEAFSNGLAVVSKGQKFGYIDTSGRVVIPLIYTKANPFNEKGEASVELNGVSMTINMEGKCIRDCPEDKKKADKKAWIDALGKDKKEAFEAYLQQFPKGAYSDKAVEKIKDFEEAEKILKAARNDEQAWQIADKQNSIAAYKNYRQKYPKGKYYNEADRRIKQLEKEQEQSQEEQAWKNALWQNTESAYRTYQRSYPSGTYYAEAGEKISDLSKPKYITDKRNGYKILNLNGKTWLAENLNLKVNDSWCYGDEDENCQKYGRLYTRQAAQEACKKLGPGWRLPSNEEWDALINKYGYKEGTYKALIEGGNTGFAALLGGVRSSDGKYAGLGRIGFYWSWPCNGVGGDGACYFEFRGDYEQADLVIGFVKSSALACRCLQSTPSNSID